jgi:hypothetical protein
MLPALAIGREERMTRKLAVAIVHGVGKQKKEFAKALGGTLKQKFAKAIGGPGADAEVQIRGVYWAEELQRPEDHLDALVDLAHLRWDDARHVMIDLGGDAIAYQSDAVANQTGGVGSGAYEAVHETFAGTLKALVADTDPDAPLCIISHSLGTVITSNYVWDLQRPENIPAGVKAMMGDTPLEHGETLALMYTMGSPIAVWGLRFPDFGTAITFPPTELKTHHPEIPATWDNMYDRDDVIAYPLKELNDSYNASVTNDVVVQVGPWWSGWTPASHTAYWRDNDVANKITDGLVAVWRSINPGS